MHREAAAPADVAAGVDLDAATIDRGVHLARGTRCGCSGRGPRRRWWGRPDSGRRRAPMGHGHAIAGVGHVRRELPATARTRPCPRRPRIRLVEPGLVVADGVGGGVGGFNLREVGGRVGAARGDGGEQSSGEELSESVIAHAVPHRHGCPNTFARRGPRRISARWAS